ncbi:glycoside hydrolase family 12 protein [Artomyces pyxidatus]|uniref:Glycoside hydrolase family 12 protein n=1 Tax=Artomyces pyxidatus TaxID=48021 RepID=A0ACB8SFD7_9AGAM|nr:glycoside hydrolase family 12 protein [Artomyces pyxidatus]
MLFTLLPIILATAAVTLPLASPLDTSAHCGQWDSVGAGSTYSLLLDQWGLSGATSGSDCARITSLQGSTIAWVTNWTWTGGSGVKSFTNMQLDVGLDRQLANITSIPTVWDWSQSTQGKIVADVAYDLFTSATPGGSGANEIMIWLANFNAGPISAVYNSDGTPQPVASNISLAGHTWDLYSGSNGANNVFSFLPTNGTITTFNGDVNTFLKYLTAHEGLSTSQYLITAQAGTEATSGTATLTTTKYSLTIE